MVSQSRQATLDLGMTFPKFHPVGEKRRANFKTTDILLSYKEGEAAPTHGMDVYPNKTGTCPETGESRRQGSQLAGAERDPKEASNALGPTPPGKSVPSCLPGGS